MSSYLYIIILLRNSFVYPGDSALLLLVSPKMNLELNQLEVSLQEKIHVGLDLIVAGFPKKPKTLSTAVQA